MSDELLGLVTAITASSLEPHELAELRRFITKIRRARMERLRDGIPERVRPLPVRRRRPKPKD